MKLSRRQTLSLVGGGVIVAATASTGFAITRQPRRALAPWSAAGGYADVRMNALSWAILAPNPHNRQPWRIDLSVPGQVTLLVDTDRLLPHTDPFSRQIVIGLGCFLELMRMAASHTGFDVRFDLFPEGSDAARLDGRPVAVATFEERDVTPDPLFRYAPDRRTLKEPYDLQRPVDPAVLSRIANAARHTHVAATEEPEMVQTFRALSREALIIEVETPHTFKESVDLFRIGHKEVDANPDGIDFSGPIFEAMALAGLFSREATLDTSSTAYQQGMAAVLENADTGMAHLWQVTDTNTREDQIAAGRDWLRLHLAATAEGVGMQPLSQCLQEYPEMSDLYQMAHEIMAPDGGTVQMFARLGYGKAVPASPRWPLEAKVIG